MKPFVSIKANREKLEEIKSFYSDYLLDNSGEYVYFFAKKNDVEITGYISKKENSKVTFQGDEALKEALQFDETATEMEPKVRQKEEWKFFDNQIGSDEVGVGDFFGPLIVVAAYVSWLDITTLKELGVDDSKRLSDEKIREIAPELVKRFKYSKLTISNDKYNEVISKGENLNSVKANMHNRALANLVSLYPEVDNIFVDQFCVRKTYYGYLNDDKEVKVTGIQFSTKGESFFPCVALASVIARYSFLLEMDKLKEKYGVEFPKGASNKVNDFAKSLLEKIGIEEFDKLVKKNFKNYQEVTAEKLV